MLSGSSGSRRGLQLSIPIDLTHVERMCTRAARAPKRLSYSVIYVNYVICCNICHILQGLQDTEDNLSNLSMMMPNGAGPGMN